MRRVIMLVLTLISCGPPPPAPLAPVVATSGAARSPTTPPHLATPHLDVESWGDDDLAVLGDPASIRHLVVDLPTPIQGEPPAELSLPAIAGLPNLRYLAVRARQLENASALQNLAHLEVLVFDGSTRLRRLGDLHSLPALRHLSLHATAIDDLTPLAGLPLRSLDLGGTAATRLEPLGGLTDLEALNLAGTFARDLAPLRALRNLRALDLSHVPARDLSPLGALTCLRRLIADGVAPFDLTVIASANQLQALALRGVGLRDLTPLRSHPALQELWLGANPTLEDITSLAELADLRFLDLSNTAVRDLTPLLGVAALEQLDIAGTPIAPAAVERFREQRPDVRVHERVPAPSVPFRSSSEAARTRAAIIAAEETCARIPSPTPTRLWAGKTGGPVVILPRDSDDPRAPCIASQLEKAALAPRTGGGVFIPAKP